MTLVRTRHLLKSPIAQTTEQCSDQRLLNRANNLPVSQNIWGSRRNGCGIGVELSQSFQIFGARNNPPLILARKGVVTVECYSDFSRRLGGQRHTSPID